MIGGHAVRVTHPLVDAVSTLPKALAKTLTWDLGHEMAQHQQFTIATGVRVYFCDPKSPWQRGSNETPTACCVSTCPDGSTSAP